MMNSLYLSDGKLDCRNLETPRPAQNEALVKVSMAGICNTDLELVKGYMGFQGVPGHEFVGTVVEGKEMWTGRRVCGEINFGCGTCRFCRIGLQRHCPNRSVLGILNQNGAFAEYVVVPLENLREIPDSISDRQAVFVEPLAAAMEILEQIQIQPDEDVAVVGDGKLGLLIGQALRLPGCSVSIIGKHKSKLEIAEMCGLKGLMLDQAAGSQFDLVVEASGSPSGFETAMSLLRPRGRLVLKSTYAANLELNASAIVINEVSVIGSRCGQFEPAIRVLKRDLVNVEALVAQVFSFQEALTAFEYAAQPGILKVLLDLNG